MKRQEALAMKLWCGIAAAISWSGMTIRRKVIAL
jgi:hypothetical protein